MPSKNKPNAFIVYAQSIRQQLIREGHAISSTADLVSAAGPYWKDLSEEEKNVYKNLAKDQSFRGSNRPNTERPDRKDNTGALIANRVNTDEVRRQRLIKERLEVSRHWPPGNDVIHERFYFISFGVTLDLRHLEIDDCEKIVPCEVSLSEYCLAQGIERTMHKFINPGKIRLGFRATAMSKSDNTHGIPIEGLAEEGDSYSRIYEDLCCFLMVGKRVMPPVFCKATDVEQNELALTWLANNSGKKPVIKKVYELEGLLLDVENHLQGKKPDFDPAKRSQATRLLSSSVYDYERGKRCKFHEEIDSKHCTLGIVKKWGYLLSDYLCPKAGVDVTQNHLPSITDDDADAVASVQVPRSRSTNHTNMFNQQIQQQVQWQQTPQQQQYQQRQQQQQGYQVAQRQQQNSNSNGNTNPIPNGTTGNQQIKPPVIGRGRGLAQALVQQRRPGERPQEPKKLVAGRGRASIVDIARSSSSNVGVAKAPFGMAVGGSTSSSEEEPSARPKPLGMGDQKFALSSAAPPASFAPQPPTEWMFS